MAAGITSAVGDYWVLCKPRVVALMLVTSAIGMLLASPTLPPLEVLLLGNLGIALCAGAAAAINHLADRHVDARMARTAGRPLPEGRLSPGRVLIFVLALGISGSLLLIWRINWLTAALTIAALFGYALVYTLYLKWATPLNIVIGGLAGAAPPLLGWAAVTGSLHPQPLLLVLIIYAWTPPHFWALALYRKREYAAAGVPMLPVTHGDRYTRWQILFYTLLLFASSLLPFAAGFHGLIYLLAALMLGLGYLYWAVILLLNKDPSISLGAFRYSIIYLAALFSAMLVDHYALPAGGRFLP